jgi:hypothetical protein
MFMTQYFILALLFVMILGREFFGMPEIEAGYLLIASLFVSSIYYLVMRGFLGRKGEL